MMEHIKIMPILYRDIRRFKEKGDKLVTEESVTKSSMKVSDIKTTHWSKMLPMVKN